MCNESTGETLVVGTLDQLQFIVDRWGAYERAWAHHDVGRVEVMSLGGRGLERSLPRPPERSFADPKCPTVGLIQHDPRLGHALAHRLQREFDHDTKLLSHGPRVMCEPSFALDVASAGSGSGAPSVEYDPHRVQLAAATHRGDGRTVAVMDSGEATDGMMVDFLRTAARELPSQDAFGHGTAVSGLIRALRDKAEVRAVRVIDDYGRSDAGDVLRAMIYCLWSGSFDVVNASLTSQLANSCETSAGAAFDFAIRLIEAEGGTVRTKLVAAAGNSTSRQRLGYPALLQGAEVAIAVDWDGGDPGYNVDVSGAPGVVTAAYGGTAASPYGWIRRSSGDEAIWGTSFAAAALSASHLGMQ
jgi:subtilisin family serine protease